MKVIPYELARLKIHLTELSELVNKAKECKEKYWDYMTKYEKDNLIAVIKKNSNTLNLIKKMLKDKLNTGAKQNEKSNKKTTRGSKKKLQI